LTPAMATDQAPIPKPFAKNVKVVKVRAVASALIGMSRYCGALTSTL
jgi:hypothetical protein